MKFKYVNLGQTVMRYETPLNIYNDINNLYENKFSILGKANKQLIGKIVNEHSVFYDGLDNKSRMKKHNFLSLEVKQWFIDMFKHYLNFNFIKEYDVHLNSVWINEMKVNEYNPVHVHQGSMATGLSSVMILKLPSTFGVEYSSEENPQNGKLQILGSSSGQFAKIDYEPEVSVRDFYIFPYDMRHCVYPFNGTKETRRTLAANCDVKYNPIINRGVS
tara:strand:- start:1184 stop:1837 length:654 start_codon:yes stop_codon:yes gene_type:complete